MKYVIFFMFYLIHYSHFSQQKNDFYNFFEKYNTIKKAMIIKTTNGLEENNYEKINLEIDSNFLPLVTPGIVVGKFFYKNYNIIICGFAASVYIPYMIIYDKGGKIIDFIQIGETCGSGEDYNCEEYIIIDIETKKIYQMFIENKFLRVREFSIKKNGRIQKKRILWHTKQNINLKEKNKS